VRLQFHCGQCGHNARLLASDFVMFVNPSKSLEPAALSMRQMRHKGLQNHRY
jgi:hypothetical protein